MGLLEVEVDLGVMPLLPHGSEDLAPEPLLFGNPDVMPPMPTPENTAQHLCVCDVMRSCA